MLLFVFRFVLTALLLQENGEIRESVVKAHVLVFLLIAVSTETLSFFGIVNSQTTLLKYSIKETLVPVTANGRGTEEKIIEISPLASQLEKRS
jgi:hypothetical protein